MGTFILRIQRKQGGLVGVGCKTDVTIDGGYKRTFKPGDIQEYELPDIPVNIKLFTGVPIGKNMEHTFVLNPMGRKMVTVLFSYKMNPKYFLPFGAFKYPQFLFETESVYGEPAAAQQQAAPLYQQAVNEPQNTVNVSSQKLQRDHVFCPECGTKNNGTAKFCINCGHKITF